MLNYQRFVQYLPIVPLAGNGYILHDGDTIRVEGSLNEKTDHYKIITIPVHPRIAVNSDPFRVLVECDDPRECYNPEHEIDDYTHNSYLMSIKRREAENTLHHKVRRTISVVGELPSLLRYALSSSAQKEAVRAAALKAEEEAQAVKDEAKRKAILHATEQLEGSTTVIQGNELLLLAADKETVLLTVDLNPIIPEGWVTRIEHLDGGQLGYFGIVTCHPDHLDEVAEVHKLGNADYRSADEEQCKHTPSSECDNQTTWVRQGNKKTGFRLEDTSSLLCEREAGHVGMHQSVLNSSYFRWDDNKLQNCLYRFDRWSWDGGLYPYPVLDFGFRNACEYCGFVSGGNSTRNQLCISCGDWKPRLKYISEEEAFVINGDYYHVKSDLTDEVRHVLKKDGSVWEGSLYKAKPIPEWLLHLFPDNASFSES